MRLTTLLCTVALATIANAICYITGEKWGVDKQDALDQARASCHTPIDGNGFLGPWTSDNPERQLVAFLASNDRLVRLKLSHRHNGGIDEAGNLDPEECYDRFQKEINGCIFGGKSKYTHWTYDADVNQI
ncbi:hypothetical protein F5Y13DRAFT_191634 [Hypoxylon sp. FL1857]|nr:hypothetical protein F5Y13DRAFT_191634 [Hypoxylon sp. FL1857]